MMTTLGFSEPKLKPLKQLFSALTADKKHKEETITLRKVTKQLQLEKLGIPVFC